MLTRAELTRLIDHTLLDPAATPADVAALCAEASELGVYAVCVSPSMLPLPAGALPTPVTVAAVCGFPSGAHQSAIKAAEAVRAVEQGAAEIDMVMDLGRAKAGDWATVESDIAAVRAGVPGTVLLKVILETAVLTAEEVVAACGAAEAAGADFVKTSTGFSRAGGASERAVRLMAETVGGRLGVKASGGIRTARAAIAMVHAGATRLGMSETRTVLAGLPE